MAEALRGGQPLFTPIRTCTDGGVLCSEGDRRSYLRKGKGAMSLEVTPAVGRLGMPLTVERYEQSVSAPPLCEQLRILDLLEDVAVQIDGSLVAGYEVGGIQSYYASDEGRNRLKGLLEALVRSLPERSVRMQVRFEISEGTGDLVSRYIRERRNESQVLRELDRLHVELWQGRVAAGFCLQDF